MYWLILSAFLISSLLTAGIVFAALWLGWSARDKVGQSLHEAYVGPVGSTENLPDSIMLMDYEAKDIDEEDNEFD